MDGFRQTAEVVRPSRPLLEAANMRRARRKCTGVEATKLCSGIQRQFLPLAPLPPLVDRQAACSSIEQPPIVRTSESTRYINIGLQLASKLFSHGEHSELP